MIETDSGDSVVENGYSLVLPKVYPFSPQETRCKKYRPSFSLWWVSRWV